MTGLFEELRRRNVVRVAVAYLTAAWLIVELITTLGDLVRLPDWSGLLLRLRDHRSASPGSRLLHVGEPFSGDAVLVSPMHFFLPEDWPHLPEVQGALFALRRSLIKAGTGRTYSPYDLVR